MRYRPTLRRLSCTESSVISVAPGATLLTICVRLPLPLACGRVRRFLAFVSDGYFQSNACLNELRAASKLGRPLLLVHEISPIHGGILPEHALSDCPQELSEYVHGAQSIILWHRHKDLQACALIRIAERLLDATMVLRPSTRKKSLDMQAITEGLLKAKQLQSRMCKGLKWRESGERESAQSSYGDGVERVTTRSSQWLGIRTVGAQRSGEENSGSRKPSARQSDSPTSTAQSPEISPVSVGTTKQLKRSFTKLAPTKLKLPKGVSYADL